MHGIGEVDLVAVETQNELKYPCIVIDGIVVKQQLTPFLIESEKDSLITVPLYGLKDNKPKYIGLMALTHYAVIRLTYIGLTITYWQSENKNTDFSSLDELVSICTSKAVRNV